MIHRSSAGIKFIWNKKDINFIKNNFYKLTNKQLADSLGIKLTLLRTQALSMGLKRMEMEYWTPEMVTYLKRNFPKMGDTEIAERFTKLYPKNKKWNRRHIEKKRKYLNLNRTNEQLLSIKNRNTKQGRNPGYWKTHQDLICEEGTIKVWTRPSGKKFKVIKTKSGFVNYPPYFYRKNIGPIKKGHVIRLKDGNPLNITINNLEMITREQNAILNAEIRGNYPEDLKEMIKLTNKLKKTIKQHEQH